MRQLIAVRAATLALLTTAGTTVWRKRRRMTVCGPTRPYPGRACQGAWLSCLSLPGVWWCTTRVSLDTMQALAAG